MRWLTNLGFRVRALLGRRQMERDMNDEFEFHLEMEAKKYEAQGIEPLEAHRLARVKFGGVDRQKEHTRGSWGVGALNDFGGDLRYAGRQLRKHPAFLALAALTLALGIGGTVALGSVAHGLMLRPLPVGRRGPVGHVLVRLQRRPGTRPATPSWCPCENISWAMSDLRFCSFSGPSASSF